MATPRKRPEDKLKAGQPTKFRPEFNEQVRHLCLLGAKDEQLARFFKVDTSTVSNWKVEYPEFFQAINEAKEEHDREVVKSLKDRALGYSHKSEKIFQTKEGKILRAETIEQYPPDTTAAIFWLKNRQPKEWRDRSEVDHSSSDGSMSPVSSMTDEQLDEVIRKLSAEK